MAAVRHGRAGASVAVAGLVATPQRAFAPQTRLRLAVALSLLNGLAHGASLAAFPVLTEAERAFFTVLLLGLCTGAVGTTAGHRPLFIAYTLPVLIPLTVLWAWSPQAHDPSWMERSLALLIALYFLILLGLAREAWKRFLESVRIRYQERSLNLKLQAALLHANEANLAKTRFLAAASHNLRQPLHTVGLLVAALSLRPANQRDKEIIDLLGQVTVALSAQLDGLLDISKLDAGVVFAENKVFNLDELLRQHHAELDTAAHAQGLQAHLKSTANVFVETDPNLFLRVLRNLTDNALKFTESGFVGLELTTAAGRAVVVVRDSGMGIPRELQAQVFEEFYQVHNPERDRSKGLGLGLSIVRRLADLLGIEIAMDSTPGAGTVFELRLPLARRPEPVANKNHVPDEHYLGLNVLVLDDERSVRYSIRLCSKRWAAHAWTPVPRRKRWNSRGSGAPTWSSRTCACAATKTESLRYEPCARCAAMFRHCLSAATRRPIACRMPSGPGSGCFTNRWD